MNFYTLFLLLTRTDFHSINPLSMKNFVVINTISPFIFIQNIYKRITTNYDTHPNNNGKDDASVPIHQLHILNNSKYQKQKRK